MKSKIYRNKIIGYIVFRFTSGEKTIGTIPVIMGIDGVPNIQKLASDQEIIGVIAANDDYQVWGVFGNHGDEPLGYEFGSKSMKPNWPTEYKKKAKSISESKKKIKAMLK